MKISTKGRYALRMLLDLAQHRDKGFVPLKDIAERQNVSKKYLEQIVPILNKSDMLQTNRGFQGGYRLAKEPDQYTVGEILRITEGNLAPVACLTHHSADLAGAVSYNYRISGRNHPAGYSAAAAGGIRCRTQRKRANGKNPAE